MSNLIKDRRTFTTAALGNGAAVSVLSKTTTLSSVTATTADVIDGGILKIEIEFVL